MKPPVIVNWEKVVAIALLDAGNIAEGIEHMRRSLAARIDRAGDTALASMTSLPHRLDAIPRGSHRNYTLAHLRETRGAIATELRGDK